MEQVERDAFIRSVNLRGLLSFAPDTEPLELRPLNVLIGPNGSGKSNVIEAFELLRALPNDLAGAIRDGGGAREWLWKGSAKPSPASIEVVTGSETPTHRPLRYKLEFAAADSRTEVIDEAIEEPERLPGKADSFFYYRFQRGNPAINMRLGENGKISKRQLKRDSLIPDQSVLAQRKDPDLYPEVTWMGEQFGSIQTYREWAFGRYSPLRQPQPADLPGNRLLPDSRNLAHVLNQIEHQNGNRVNEILKRFFPRFARLSTLVSGGTIQLYLHETGFSSPIPATRLSDGTIRLLSLLALLLAPTPPPLVCIEEPELGLHPDAVSLVAELLISASERTQIVVTTHSDALVSALTGEVESVITCERLGGSTVLRRLEANKLETWLQDYRLGDLWRIGELGANP